MPRQPAKKKVHKGKRCSKFKGKPNKKGNATCSKFIPRVPKKVPKKKVTPKKKPVAKKKKPVSKKPVAPPGHKYDHKKKKSVNNGKIRTEAPRKKSLGDIALDKFNAKAGYVCDPKTKKCFWKPSSLSDAPQIPLPRVPETPIQRRLREIHEMSRYDGMPKIPNPPLPAKLTTAAMQQRLRNIRQISKPSVDIKKEATVESDDDDSQEYNTATGTYSTRNTGIKPYTGKVHRYLELMNRDFGRKRPQKREEIHYNKIINDDNSTISKVINDPGSIGSIVRNIIKPPSYNPNNPNIDPVIGEVYGSSGEEPLEFINRHWIKEYDKNKPINNFSLTKKGLNSREKYIENVKTKPLFKENFRGPRALEGGSKKKPKKFLDLDRMNRYEAAKEMNPILIKDGYYRNLPTISSVMNEDYNTWLKRELKKIKKKS